MNLHLSVRTESIAEWSDRLGRGIEALEAADGLRAETLAGPLSQLLDALAPGLLVLTGREGAVVTGRPSATAEAYVALIEALASDMNRVAAR